MIARLILLASCAAATASWLRTALSSETVCEPRQCGTDDRHVVTRLTPAQVRQWTEDHEITCRVRRCDGTMHRVGDLDRLRQDARIEGGHHRECVCEDEFQPCTCCSCTRCWTRSRVVDW